MTQTALLHAASALATAIQMPPGDAQTAAIVAATIHLDAVFASQHRAELTELRTALASLRAALRVRTAAQQQALEPIYDRLHTLGNNIGELLARLDEHADVASQDRERLDLIETQALRALRELADIRQWHAVAVPAPPSAQ